MSTPVVSYPIDYVPESESEKAGFQLLADGLNLIGYANRKKMRRRRWHRVTVWVRWTGIRQLEVSDLTLVEDRHYGQ